MVCLLKKLLAFDGLVCNENCRHLVLGYQFCTTCFHSLSLDWFGPPPPKGCEIFVGRIHREVYEDELYRVFSVIGPIYELRLMMDFGGTNRGFAFIQYTNPLDASNAIKKMNNFELRPNFRIGVLKSVDNCRLFIGGIPKERPREEILAEMQRLTDGVTNVIVYRLVLFVAICIMLLYFHYCHLNVSIVAVQL